MRKNRNTNQLREVSITPNVNAYAEGSCIVKFGNTHVICTASVEEKVPPFLKNKGRGWVTAEYNMLARSTHQRINRDPMKPNGRNIEIQRLIGRSLRSVVDLEKLGERQIVIDCDVLQADGGTRCAAITGGFVALSLAIQKLLQQKSLARNPIISSVCAVSCGIVDGEVVVDLDYQEDSNCETDANFVINQNLDLIEVQGTAEKGAMSFEQLSQMYKLASDAARIIAKIQQDSLV